MDLLAGDAFATCQFYFSDKNQVTMNLMNGYLKNDWELWNKELKDVFNNAGSKVYMYMRSCFKSLCKDQLDCGNISLKAGIVSPMMTSATP